MCVGGTGEVEVEKLVSASKNSWLAIASKMAQQSRRRGWK